LLACACRSADEHVLRRILQSDDLDWDRVLMQAAEHGLSALLYHNLEEKELLQYPPEAAKTILEKRHHATAFANLRLSRELTRLGTRLHTPSP